MSIKSTSNDSPSFAAVYTEQRRAKARNEFLERVDLLIDWRPIQTFINKKLNKTAEAKGEATYDGVLMFKILLLEVWYNLSDRGVEERINDSISFGKFLRIDIEHVSPDHSTICRFRNALVEKGLWDKLLAMINKQLKKHGIMEIKRGVLVDASIVDSPFSPDGSIKIEVADDREDHRSEEEKIKEQKYMATLCSGKPGVDTEGRWVKKGGEFRFGYKKHVGTTDEGLIEGVITTPANVSDTREFTNLIDKLKLPKGVEVLADKGYTSKGNSEHLRQSNLTDKIMKKAKRGKVLGEEEKAFNRLISKARCKVERTFGSIRRWFKGSRCRYKGLLKTHGQNILESICHNLKRAPMMIIQLDVATK